MSGSEECVAKSDWLDRVATFRPGQNYMHFSSDFLVFSTFSSYFFKIYHLLHYYFPQIEWGGGGGAQTVITNAMESVTKILGLPK